MKPEKYRLSAVEFASVINSLRLTPVTVRIIKPMVVNGLTHREAIEGHSEIISESAASRAIRKLKDYFEAKPCAACGSVDGPGAPVLVGYEITKGGRFKMTSEQFDFAMTQLSFERPTMLVIKRMVVKGATYREAIEGKALQISESAASRAIRKLRLFCESPRCTECGSVLISPALQIAPQKPPRKDKAK